MAIYHLSMKAISRKDGRSVTAAAAYRAGVEITDERTGEVHDYRRKAGVSHSELMLPGGQSVDRAEFWNGVEKHHKRGDAAVGREVVVALPSELSPESRLELARTFAKEMVARYGVAADVAIHEPSKDGDDRNHHAHILMSACLVGLDGQLGKKAVALDPISSKRDKDGPGQAPLEWMRPRWAELVNAELARNRLAARVDHRSHAARGVEELPTKHLGPTATAMERKGRQSRAGQENRDVRRVNRQRRNLKDHEAKQQVEADRAEAARHQAELDREGQRGIRGWQRDNIKRSRSSMGGAALPPEKALGELLAGKCKVYEHPGRTVLYIVSEKTTVIDKGDLITCGRGTGQNPSAAQVALMAATAKCKGWERVTLTGPAEFQQRAVRELARQGVTVANPELQAAWQAARAELEKPAPQPVEPAKPAKPKQQLGGVRGRWTPPPPPAPLTVPGGEASPDRPAPTLHQVEEATDRINALDKQIEALDKRAAGLRDRRIDSDEMRRTEMDRMNKEADAALKPRPFEERYGYRHQSPYEFNLKCAQEALSEHQKQPRPMLFGAKEYDAKTAELQRQLAGWQSAIQQRDRTLAARVEAATVTAQKEAALQSRQNAAERAQIDELKQPLVAERGRAREALTALYDAVPVARHGDTISGKFLKARKVHGEVCSLVEQAGGRLVAVRGVFNVDAGRNVALVVDDSKDVYPRDVALPTPKGRGRGSNWER